ncbi:MAG: DUF2203 domain-containing protein [Bacillota bacterium]|nr:MAG: DUF2203 domain-containing protein [Bacillota bacterium]
MFVRYFTLAEANACIPELERLIRYLQSLLSEMEEKLNRLREEKERARKAGVRVDASTFFAQEAELDFLKLEARSHINRIKEMGAVLQDIHSGLVDFPALVDGQEVLLCWRLGEPSVQYYHGLTEGFVGRKPVPPEWLKETPPGQPGAQG